MAPATRRMMEKQTMADRTVLFLCPHAAAKSVLAAAYFDREARRVGLDARADNAGTEPDPVTAPRVVAALAAEGIDVSGGTPRLVTQADLAGAWRIVSLGCDVDAPAGTPVEHWDVPPTGQDMDAARAAIRGRVEHLVATLATNPA
jgi:arsenate reductase